MSRSERGWFFVFNAQRGDGRPVCDQVVGGGGFEGLRLEFWFMGAIRLAVNIENMMVPM
ncbi:MAG: hypothetical protein PHP44_11700 [Kiritimatiellae bacterium]|nr:hypothetical protein [Kiritimatiellia bacterium]